MLHGVEYFASVLSSGFPINLDFQKYCSFRRYMYGSVLASQAQCPAGTKFGLGPNIGVAFQIRWAISTVPLTLPSHSWHGWFPLFLNWRCRAIPVSFHNFFCVVQFLKDDLSLSLSVAIFKSKTILRRAQIQVYWIACFPSSRHTFSAMHAVACVSSSTYPHLCGPLFALPGFCPGARLPALSVAQAPSLMHIHSRPSQFAPTLIRSGPTPCHTHLWPHPYSATNLRQLSCRPVPQCRTLQQQYRTEVKSEAPDLEEVYNFSVFSVTYINLSWGRNFDFDNQSTFRI